MKKLALLILLAVPAPALAQTEDLSDCIRVSLDASPHVGGIGDEILLWDYTFTNLCGKLVQLRHARRINAGDTWMSQTWDLNSGDSRSSTISWSDRVNLPPRPLLMYCADNPRGFGARGRCVGENDFREGSGINWRPGQ